MRWVDVKLDGVWPDVESAEDLAAALPVLDEQPVGAHPDLLERLHRAIVAELDALASYPKPPNAR